MRKLTAGEHRLRVVPAALCAILPAVLLFSRNAHSPLKDAAVGLTCGLLLGFAITSLIRMRRSP